MRFTQNGDYTVNVTGSDKAGNTVSSVTEINLDGSHPRVAITKLKAYKDAIKEVSA